MNRNALSLTSSWIALIAAASAFALTTSAQASGAHVKSASYSAQAAGATLHVISTDGKTWNGFKAGQLHFNATMKVDTRWPGYINYVGIVLGQCSGQQCAARPRVWGTLIKSRDMDKQVALYFNSGLIPLTSQGGIAVIPDGDQILAKCNQHLAADGPTRKHTFQHELPTTFAAGTGKASNLDKVPIEVHSAGIPFPSEVDLARTAKISINVVCSPVKKRAGNFAAAEPEFKVMGISARLMTFSHATTSPNPGTKCETGKARVRISTSKAGPVKFRLWSKIGNAPMQSQVIEAWSSFKGPGKFEAVYEKSLTTSKTAVLQFMAEDVTNAIGQSTGWKKGRLDCTGAGGGGLASPTSNANPDNANRPKGGIVRNPFPKGPNGLTGQTRPTHRPSAQREGVKIKTAPARTGETHGRLGQKLGAARRETTARTAVGGKTTFQRWKPH